MPRNLFRGWRGWGLKVCAKRKKPWFKKSEMHGGLPLGTVVSASKIKREGGDKMALAHAMWVHGHSMQIEYPDRLYSIKRRGMYIRVDAKANTTNWFHFAIPTPVIVNDNRLRADSVMVRFRMGSAEPDGWVNAIHVWDGERNIARHNDLHIAPTRWEWPRFDVPGNPNIRWGLGISIGVAFSVSPGQADRRMEFSSAGCDFLP